MSDNQVELLLYIDDPDNHLIHCCNYEKYLTSATVSNYGICSLNDGNLIIITRKDIRALNVQDYLRRNNYNKYLKIFHLQIKELVAEPRGS
jgi:hypothetical protein